MTIHKCDICGKEMDVWFKLVLTVEASRPEANVADIIHLQGSTEICKDCYLSRNKRGGQVNDCYGEKASADL